MKKLLLSLLCLFTMLHMGSAQWNHGKSVKGSGHLAKESRNVSGFDAVGVSSGIDVYLHQGNEERVEIETDDNIIPLIKTEVSGNKLKIYMENSYSHVEKMRVDVWFKNMRNVSASGGSDVYSVGTITSSSLGISGSGGSDFKMAVKVDNLECNVSGGSDIDLSGSAHSVNIDSSGGSDINATDFMASRCKINASGGSDVDIQVSDELDVSASGASDVHYKGNPKVISKKLSGSSEISN